jgi:hypothetical protein
MAARTDIWSHSAATRRLESYEAQPTRSATAEVFHLVKRGEPFRLQEIGEQVGASAGVVNLLVKTMRSAGYRFSRKRVGVNGLELQVVGTPPDYAAEEVTQATKRAAVAAVARDLPTEPPAPFPTLGGQLQVRALALDEAGQLAMQLSDGNGRSWRVVVTGHVL